MIRPLSKADLPAVAALNNRYLGNGTMRLVPYLASDFLPYLPERKERYAMVVAVEDDQVVGFASIKPYSPRRGYYHAAENSVYLLPSRTGKGVGTALMKAIMQVALRLDYQYLAAKIWTRNQGSIRFHERLGFTTVGQQRNIGFVDGEWIGTTIMEAILPEILTEA
ncbi:MAG: N-acetyltransferase family protein [Bacteroidota bacterium]